MLEEEIIDNIRRLQDAGPGIFNLLKISHDLRAVRSMLQVYLSHKDIVISEPEAGLHSLEHIIAKDAIMVMRNIISIGNEKKADFSALKLLRDLARHDLEGIPAELSPGFFEEFRHLFKAIELKTRVYEDKRMPTHLLMTGRRAALERSRDLDALFMRAKSFMDRYPTGLEKNVIRRRLRNRARILKTLDSGIDDWEDWHWHVRNVARTSKEMGRLVHLSPEEIESIDIATANRIPFGVTPYYAHLMDNRKDRTSDHAVRAQVIPPPGYVEKMSLMKDSRTIACDFMHERDTSPVPLITRRYPMICILKPYNACPQICVYCQRNWEIEGVMSKKAMASKAQLDRAIGWIRAHPAIIEVLVTGGDPLAMSNSRIRDILARLAAIDHVERIRIGTRTPVTVPSRIDDGLIEVLGTYHEPPRREICMVTHVEHVYEVTPEMVRAVQAIRKAGISVYNQMVFTIENSRRFEAAALRRLLRLVGIDPYYTFSMKGKDETNEYKVPIARILQEVKEEARLLPGLARRDAAVYNVPKLGKNYLTRWQHHELVSILPDGRRVYEFHPWEKKIQLTETYIGTDMCIHDYLEEMRKRGEDHEDYRTIWYYY